MLALSNAALYGANAWQWQDKWDPDAQPWSLFVQYDNAAPIALSVLAFAFYFSAALLPYVTSTKSGQTEPSFPPKVADGALIVASLLTMVTCAMLLSYGFGDAHAGWNQPDTPKEIGVFSFVWGGLLAASTATLARGVYQAAKPTPAQ